MKKMNIDYTLGVTVILLAVFLALSATIHPRAKQEGYREGAIKTCMDNSDKGCNVNELKSKFYSEDNPN